MTTLTDWDLQLSVDQVLRSQGADPAVLRARSPKAVQVAERALAEGAPLLAPVVVYRECKVKSVGHGRMNLEDGSAITSKTLIRLLAPAKKVIVVAASIGPTLERYSSMILRSDPPYGLALDGLGSAAVEALSAAVCSYFSQRAASEGMQSTLPLSPGMEDWPVDVGQTFVSSLVDLSQVGIRLTEAGMMVPQKSLSMVLGIGPDVDSSGRICDYCTQRFTCRYQEHYAG